MVGVDQASECDVLYELTIYRKNPVLKCIYLPEMFILNVKRCYLENIFIFFLNKSSKLRILKSLD